MKKGFIKKGDIILLVCVIAAAAVMYGAFQLFSNQSGQGEYVNIEVNGQSVAVLSLYEDTVYEVKADGKTVNVVEIKDGEAWMSDADCPDGVCKSHSPISKPSESIICLPNKVIITVEGAGEYELDGVVR